MRISKDPEVRKQEIINTAMGIFSEKGFEAVTMKDIAQAVGVAAGLCYHYFPNKQALYETAIRLVTDEILNQLADMPRVNIGLLHLLLQHTSASLTLNENCDPTVRHDMERFFLRTVPDNGNYEHDYEGADDMPSHIKSSMLGTSLVLPVHKGRIQTGTWQGIWLGEHRIHGGSRRIIATLQGE